MKNAEMPAMPLNADVNPHTACTGLTKREYTAIKAMQGLLTEGYTDYSELSDRAIKITDDLLYRLGWVWI